MRKQNFLYSLKRFLPPVILILLGLILTFSPDSATILLVQIIGWVLITAAIGIAASLLIPGSLFSKVLGVTLCGIAGIWMVTNPLSLAAWFGRLIGILLLIQGIQDIVYQRVLRSSLFLPILTAVVGAVLTALPMTTSRVVFIAAGIVVLIIGVLMLVERLRHPASLEEPDDPNIIDAL